MKDLKPQILPSLWHMRVILEDTVRDSSQDCVQSVKGTPGTYDLLAHLISKISPGPRGITRRLAGIGSLLIHIHLIDCNRFCWLG